MIFLIIAIYLYSLNISDASYLHFLLRNHSNPIQRCQAVESGILVDTDGSLHHVQIFQFPLLGTRYWKIHKSKPVWEHY